MSTNTKKQSLNLANPPPPCYVIALFPWNIEIIMSTIQYGCHQERIPSLNALSNKYNIYWWCHFWSRFNPWILNFNHNHDSENPYFNQIFVKCAQIAEIPQYFKHKQYVFLAHLKNSELYIIVLKYKYKIFVFVL
jgi:hypothetical protein